MDATTLLLIKMLTDSIISAASALANVNNMSDEEKAKRLSFEKERTAKLTEVLKTH